LRGPSPHPRPFPRPGARGAKELDLTRGCQVKIAQIAGSQPRAEDPHRLATSGYGWQSRVDY